MDVDDIPLGVDFSKYIDEKVGQCEVLLAVVGRDWLSATDEDGNRRLDLPGDYVRIELESALKRNIPVVPLLVRRASMPDADELPESIREFSRRNGMLIRPDPDFRTDCDRLIEGLEEDRTGKRPIVSFHSKPVVKKTNRLRKVLVRSLYGVVFACACLGIFLWIWENTGPTPSIVAFQADLNRIEKGATTTLRWTTKNARRVYIKPEIGTVPTSGSSVIAPTEDTTYTLTARGSDHNSVKRALSIQVIQSQSVAAIPSSRMSVVHSSIELGQSTTLSWQTHNATHVEIQPGIGRVEPRGSINISPQRDTTYTLKATSPAGTSTSNVQVRIKRSLPLLPLINRSNNTLRKP